MTEQAAPGRVGMSLTEVDTPALLVDLDAYERNLRKMQAFVDTARLTLRPHAKTHKCAVIAQQQVQLGAVGVCCQKVSEAEALVIAGIGDVFISNEVVGAAKLSRLALLAGRATIGVCVDDLENVDQLSRVADEHGVELDVFVELDVGAGRCGVRTADETLALAQRVTAAPGLRFKGLQAYHGGAQHIRAYTERCAASEGAIRRAAELRDRLHDSGFTCEVITGAGTGTYPSEAGSGIYTELQCGSYVFMDADYARNRAQSGEPFSDFDQSLFVYTTVMSRNRSGLAVVDAGLKALSIDSGLPLVHAPASIEYTGASDEHGILNTVANDDALRLGDKIKLVPGHCDPTVNLHDWYIGFRGENVESIWSVTARGAIY